MPPAYIDTGVIGRDERKRDTKVRLFTQQTVRIVQAKRQA